MPASASRSCATCQNHQASQIRFFSQLAHFFACSSHKKASPETRPRGAHDAGLAARLADGGDIPSVPEAFFRFGGRRAGRRCGRFRANPTHDRASSKNAPIDQRTTVPTSTPPTGSAPRRPPQPDLRRGAQQATATPPTGSAQRRATPQCAPDGRITCTALPKPPAGPSEGLA